MFAHTVLKLQGFVFAFSTCGFHLTQRYPSFSVQRLKISFKSFSTFNDLVSLLCDLLYACVATPTTPPVHCSYQILRRNAVLSFPRVHRHFPHFLTFPSKTVWPPRPPLLPWLFQGDLVLVFFFFVFSSAFHCNQNGHCLVLRFLSCSCAKWCFCHKSLLEDIPNLWSLLSTWRLYSWTSKLSSDDLASFQ